MSRRSAIGTGVRPPADDSMALIYGEAPPPPAASETVPDGSPASQPVALAHLSVRVDPGLLERARDLAYWDRLTLVAIVEAGLRAVVADYEAEHGALPQRPRSALRGKRHSVSAKP